MKTFNFFVRVIIKKQKNNITETKLDEKGKEVI